MAETKLEVTIRGELDKALSAALGPGSRGSGDDVVMTATWEWRGRPTVPAEGSGITPRQGLDNAAKAELLAELKDHGYATVKALHLCDGQRALPGRLHLERAEIKNADFEKFKWLKSDDEETKPKRRCKHVQLDYKDAYNDLERDLKKSQARLGKTGYVKLDLMGCKLNTDYPIKGDDGQENTVAANFVASDLRQANLKWTDLWNANLSGATLFQARFQGSMLARAQFGNADVTSADFRDADLGAADLSGVSGLAADKLAGASLISAKLPEAVAKFDRLAHANKSVQSANTNLIILIGACLYCWIMVARTQDIDLISSATGVALPVVGTSIPLSQFYIVAPLILLSIYVYLQYYLQAIWTDIANLPSRFPDGEAVNEKIDPWLLGVVPCKHVYRLRVLRKISLYEEATYWLTFGIAWGLAPMTILAMWLRFLPAHRPEAWVLLVLLLVSLAIMAYSAWLADATMWDGRSRYRRDEGKKTYDSKTGLERKYLMRPMFDLSRGWVIAAIALAALVGAIAAFVTCQSSLPASQRLANPPWPRLDADLAAASFGGSVAAPEAAAGAAAVAKVDLSERNLRNADLSDAVLAQADISDGRLEEANLTGANFAGADLTEAHLTGANLTGADLTGADLTGADLTGANLTKAKLAGADLSTATLAGANLDGACRDGATRLPPDVSDILSECLSTP